MTFGKKHMRVRAALIFLVAGLAACRSVHPHPWTREQPHWMWVDPKRGDVAYVSTDRLTRVKPERCNDAVAMLEAECLVELEPEQFDALAAERIGGAPDEKPYLLRGVTWSYPPWYTIVYWRPDDASLCVEQYTYNGEMYWPGDHASRASPIIAFLNKKPESIIPRAIFGGDSMMDDMSAPYAWKE